MTFRNIVNFILFQTGWFATVITVANQLEYLAALVVICIVLFHFQLVEDKFNELLLVIVAGLTGLTVDSLLIVKGFFITVGSIGIEGMAPLWLIMLWVLFAITLNHSLRWIRKTYLLAAAMGFVFAPLAYFAGQKFGVLSFSGNYSTGIVLTVIAGVWAIVIPFLVFISESVDVRPLRLTNLR